MSERQADISIVKPDELSKESRYPWLAAAMFVPIFLWILGGLYWEILRNLIWDWWNDANYLQNLAAQNAAWTLDLLGVPVLLDGNVIHLSHLSLGITEACSGIRSLISLLALAVAWAYLALPGVWARLVLVASAVPITIVANAGRVVFTGLIGQWFGVESAQGFFHTFSGWVIFLFAFACLLGVHGLIRLAGTLGHRRGA